MNAIADQAFIETIRRTLAAAADSDNAPAMQAYMKSAMPYRGVPSPERQAVVKSCLARYQWGDAAAWQATVRTLWDEATFREERYVAIDLAGHRSAAAFQLPDVVELYDHMVITGAWWDYVDAVGIRLIGPILQSYRTSVEPTVRSWITDADLWRRRVSIIVQIGAKDGTDVTLLRDAVEANTADRNFFIRKAIGWALRQHAYADPAWVRMFVDAHPNLSPLSRREATKHL